MTAVILLAVNWSNAAALLDLDPCATAADSWTSVPLNIVVAIGLLASAVVMIVSAVRQTHDRGAAVLTFVVSAVVLPAAFLLQGGPYGWHCPTL